MGYVRFSLLSLFDTSSLRPEPVDSTQSSSLSDSLNDNDSFVSSASGQINRFTRRDGNKVNWDSRLRQIADRDEGWSVCSPSRAAGCTASSSFSLTPGGSTTPGSWGPEELAEGEIREDELDMVLEVREEEQSQRSSSPVDNIDSDYNPIEDGPRPQRVPRSLTRADRKSVV